MPKARKKRRSIGERVEALLRRLELRAEATGYKRVRVPFYLLRVTLQVVRRWVHDRCPQQAGSLAFQTVLSIVPLLALTTAAMRALGLFRAESGFVNFLSTNLIPVSAEEISTKLVEYSQNITFETVGLAGLVASVILAFVMFNSLEKAVNWIWRSKRRRTITRKLVVFYGTLTVAPVLVGFSLVQAARFGLRSGVGGAFFSVGATLVAFFLANYFLPTGRVRASAALAGAVVTTVFFEVAKLGFSYYVSGYALQHYTGVYGALAIVPLWLVWIYYSWMTVLLGVVIAHAVQNLSALERGGSLPMDDLAEPEGRRASSNYDSR